MRFTTTLTPAALLLAAACGGSDEPGPANPSTNNDATNNRQTPGGPTYHADVRPLLADKCGGCHVQGGIAPFSFETYAGTAPLASVIKASVESKRMPPWGAHDTDECSVERPFKDDIRLSDEEIALIAEWADAGAPEGEPAGEPDAFGASLSTLPRVDAELVPDQGFTTAGSTDQFRCFVLDPGFTQRTFLQGLAFVPGNQKVVHHAIVYADPSGQTANLVDANGQYDCFGGPGFTDSALVSAWAPGGVPLVYPERAAMPIEAGTKLVLQIHYHPLGDAPEQDLTKIQIMHTNEAPEYLASASFIGNFGGAFGEGQGLLPGPGDRGAPEFRIPAGAEDHVEKMALTVPMRLAQDQGRFPGAYIYAVASHMHYVGTDMKIELKRGQGSAPCASSEAQPLEACVAAACPNASGFALAQCAEQSCGRELSALSLFCSSCLQEEIFAGRPDALGACTMPMSLPTDLYPGLTEQPAEECLLQTPDWDFEWQRYYPYDAEIEALPFVMPGDTFELTCRYDNSMNNPFVREALAEQGLDAPRDVVLGEETLDEMCLLAVTVFTKAP